MYSLPSTTARTLYGTGGLGVVVIMVWLSLAAYQGAFASTIPVTVETSRAGLGLVPGSQVTLHGVKVGRVAAVRLDHDGTVRIGAEIERDKARLVPATAEAVVDASSVFGPKAVEFVNTDDAKAPRIRSGTIISASAVSPEINGLFQQVGDLLRSVDVGKLNAALSGLAAALDGHGMQLRHLAGQLNGYVAAVNTTLPAVENDVRRGAVVARDYTLVTPDLLQVAQHVSTTSRTLVALKPTIGTFLASLTTTSRGADVLTLSAGEPLVGAMAMLRPAARVLGTYAPMLGCTLKGFNEVRKLVEKIAGYKKASIQAHVELLPGQKPYTYPENLPENVTGLGPDCYGLPVLKPSEMPAPHYLFKDGTQSIWEESTSDAIKPGRVTLYDSLFGSSLEGLLGELRGAGGAVGGGR